jgi:riboflavin synthase
MFTGIVQAMGTVAHRVDAAGARTFWVQCPTLAPHLDIGDSLAVNGCCLTVEENSGEQVRLTAVAETLAKTNVGLLAEGSRVNLEPAARLDSFLGGHLVSGHVDGPAYVVSVQQLGTGAEYCLRLPQALLKYVISKGSVTLDGCSLTVAEIEGDVIKVCLIPETLTKTILGSWAAGDQVNLEVDLIGKYVENFFLADPQRWSAHFAR